VVFCVILRGFCSGQWNPNGKFGSCRARFERDGGNFGDFVRNRRGYVNKD
jgi:hypothetical protein